jgi:hypothetical protein
MDGRIKTVKQYKQRGAVPRRACRKFTVMLEPTLGLRLQWLAEQRGVTYSSLLENMVTNDQEIQRVKI